MLLSQSCHRDGDYYNYHGDGQYQQCTAKIFAAEGARVARIQGNHAQPSNQ